MPSKREYIHLRGVRQNNLKGFDLDLPIGELTVVTGLSGAGKSSLVFETLHAEGQRRYVETFSPYTRQFMDLLDRPKVDSVENIRPSIAIQQSNTIKTSRSTVGTITELADYFKVWFANVATLYDPASGKAITDDTPQSVWSKLTEDHEGQSVIVTFPVTKPKNLSWEEILKSLSGQGYTRVLLRNGEGKHKMMRIDDQSSADLSVFGNRSSLLVVQDRILSMDENSRSRFIEAAQQAFHFGKGCIQILDKNTKQIADFTQSLSSPITGQTFRAAAPPQFSFNSPLGACPECRGFGRVIEIDDRLVVPDHSLSVDEGAIRAFQGEVYSESLSDLQRAAKKYKIRTNIPWSKLNKKELQFIMDGEPNYKDNCGQWYGVRRFFDWLNRKLYKMHVRVFISKFRSYTLCPKCKGARLKSDSLNWKWQGHTLPELYQKSVSNLLELLTPHAKLTSSKSQPDKETAMVGIMTRLTFMKDVGLGYLTLDRSSRSLSGGETMRVNLTSCLGSSLVDTLFVLDEPSVGLHPRDMDRLIFILRRLTELGNTVVVVEHDEAIMRIADHIIEIGPGPGRGGGELSFSGSYKRILESDTHTGRYLSGRETIDLPNIRRDTNESPQLSIYNASKHNLNDLTVHIPQQRFVCL
ncbi:MAG: excinuclease ABC subunit A, partial [Verrucomicrobiota bacterium]|nr:excinuclease ABC subunit A [Verrucomicrobiota bacterium]